MLSTWWI